MYDMGNSFIYGLIDPRDNQLRYVGKTMVGLSRALSEHSARCRNWIRSLKRQGLKQIVWIIEELPPNELNDAEVFWIGCFRMVGANLTNLTRGGEGTRLAGSLNGYYGKKHPPEVREKMRLAKLGKKQSPQHLEARRRGLKGRIQTEETRQKIRSKLNGHSVSAETIQKMRDTRIKNGKTRWSPDQRAAHTEAMKRAWETRRKKVNEKDT